MWEINDFNKWNDEGRPIDENVIELNIGYSNIEILGNLENLANLNTLCCHSNKLISLEGIEKLTNLTHLYCNNNKLTSLEGIENLINLKELYCFNNQLTSLEGIENLVNLKYLSCKNNFLTSLEEIENLNNLTYLYCSDNQLTSLEGIENLIKLIKNNKKIVNIMLYNFIDSDDHIELKNLFDNLLECKNYEKNKYIEEIEQMISKFNGYQKYVLK
jgi:Leucine-rich repeat (LRR) protein